MDPEGGHIQPVDGQALITPDDCNLHASNFTLSNDGIDFPSPMAASSTSTPPDSPTSSLTLVSFSSNSSPISLKTTPSAGRMRTLKPVNVYNAHVFPRSVRHSSLPLFELGKVWTHGNIIVPAPQHDGSHVLGDDLKPNNDQRLDAVEDLSDPGKDCTLHQYKEALARAYSRNRDLQIELEKSLKARSAQSLKLTQTQREVNLLAAVQSNINKMARRNAALEEENKKMHAEVLELRFAIGEAQDCCDARVREDQGAVNDLNRHSGNVHQYDGPGKDSYSEFTREQGAEIGRLKSDVLAMCAEALTADSQINKLVKDRNEEHERVLAFEETNDQMVVERDPAYVRANRLTRRLKAAKKQVAKREIELNDQHETAPFLRANHEDRKTDYGILKVTLAKQRRAKGHEKPSRSHPKSTKRSVTGRVAHSRSRQDKVNAQKNNWQGQFFKLRRTNVLLRQQILKVMRRTKHVSTENDNLNNLCYQAADQLLKFNEQARETELEMQQISGQLQDVEEALEAKERELSDAYVLCREGSLRANKAHRRAQIAEKVVEGFRKEQAVVAEATSKLLHAVRAEKLDIKHELIACQSKLRTMERRMEQRMTASNARGVSDTSDKGKTWFKRIFGRPGAPNLSNRET